MYTKKDGRRRTRASLDNATKAAESFREREREKI